MFRASKVPDAHVSILPPRTSFGSRFRKIRCRGEGRAGTFDFERIAGPDSCYPVGVDTGVAPQLRVKKERLVSYSGHKAHMGAMLTTGAKLAQGAKLTKGAMLILGAKLVLGATLML